MGRHRLAALWLTAILISAPLATTYASSVVYHRTPLIIRSEPAAPAGAIAEEDVSEEVQAPLQPLPVEHQFYVALEREGQQPAQTRWISDFSDIHQDYGLLLMLEESGPVRVSRSRHAVKGEVDMFFVGNYGHIHAIARSVEPTQLAQPLSVEQPTKALLYLEGGTASRRAIQVEDRLLHDLFPEPPELEQ